MEAPIETEAPAEEVKEEKSEKETLVDQLFLAFVGDQERLPKAERQGIRFALYSYPLRPHHNAAIHAQHSSSDKTGLVRCQKGISLGDFLGLAQSSQWGARLHALQ